MASDVPQDRVEVDLGRLYVGEDGPTVADVILDRAADRLLKDLPRDLRSELRARGNAVAEEELHELLRPVLTEALQEAIQPTNRLGEARGATTTLREFVVATATEALKATRESSSLSGRRRSLVEQIIHDEVELALGRELKAIVEEEGEKVRRAIREKGGELVADVARRLHS